MSAICLHFQQFVYHEGIFGPNMHFVTVFHISPALHLKVLYSLQRPWLAIKATQRLNTPCFIPILKESIGQSHARQSQRPNGHKTKMSLSASLGLDRIESFPAKFSCCPLNYVIWFLETEFENKCKKEGHSSTLVFKPPCILGSEISTENIVFLKSAVFFSGCSCAFTNGHCPD